MEDMNLFKYFIIKSSFVNDTTSIPIKKITSKFGLVLMGIRSNSNFDIYNELFINLGKFNKIIKENKRLTFDSVRENDYKNINLIYYFSSKKLSMYNVIINNTKYFDSQQPKTNYMLHFIQKFISRYSEFVHKVILLNNKTTTPDGNKQNYLITKTSSLYNSLNTPEFIPNSSEIVFMKQNKNFYNDVICLEKNHIDIINQFTLEHEIPDINKLVILSKYLGRKYPEELTLILTSTSTSTSTSTQKGKQKYVQKGGEKGGKKNKIFFISKKINL